MITMIFIIHKLSRSVQQYVSLFLLHINQSLPVYSVSDGPHTDQNIGDLDNGIKTKTKLSFIKLFKLAL